MPDYEVVPFRSELLEPLIALYGEVFERSPQECRDYLHWKYWCNPYLDEPLLFLARDRSGRMVGMRGFYGTSWRVAGQRVVIPCADDFGIVAGERGKGLMTVIMRMALDSLARRGFGYAINASGGELTVLQSLAMGWKSLGPMEPVARMTRLERARRAIVRAARRTSLGRFVSTRIRYPSGSFDELDRHRSEASTGARDIVVGSSPRPEAMAELVRSTAPDGRIRHVRDADFFRWRFGNPTREYRFLYFERNEVLEGFIAVAGYRQSNNPQCNIVDIEAKNEIVLAELLQSACDWGRFPAIGTWLASHTPAARALLTRHGFVPVERRTRARGMPCVLLKKIGSAQDATIDGAAWDIRLIDSMHG